MKILIYSWPKTGSSLLFSSLKKSLKYEHTLFEPLKKSIVKNKINNNNLLVKSHINHNIVDDMFSIFDKKIFLVRDPRDIIISHFFYRFKHAKKENIQRAINIVKQKELNPKSIPFHKLIENFSHINPEMFNRNYSFINKDWTIYKYENLIKHNFNQLNEYLDINVVYDDVDSGNQWIKRSQTYDNWKRWFTKEDEIYYKHRLTNFFNKFEYNDWNILNVNKINSLDGSDYLKKFIK